MSPGRATSIAGPTNGDGQIDILLPEGIGARAKRRGLRGGTTLETPGAQNVLHRAEPLKVSLEGFEGTIFRPSLQGALLAKAYAYSVVNDSLRRRHLEDLAALVGLIRISDKVGKGLLTKERNKLFMAYKVATEDSYVQAIAGAEEGFARLQQAIWPRLSAE